LGFFIDFSRSTLNKQQSSTTLISQTEQSPQPFGKKTDSETSFSGSASTCSGTEYAFSHQQSIRYLSAQ
jgi:hypothetical protein